MLALRMIARRVVLSIVTLLLVSLFIFLMVEALPGDAATRYLGRLATEEQKSVAAHLAQTRHPGAGALREVARQYGLPRLRYHDGAGPADQRGTRTEDREHPHSRRGPIRSLPAVVVDPCVDPGAESGQRPRPRFLGAHSGAASTPDFLLATLLLLLLVVAFPLLPAMSVVDAATTFQEFARALVLPALTLGLVMSVYAVRFLRDELIEVLDSDYIRMAHLNGLPRRVILLPHALPNTLIPALNIAYMMGGVVIVERLLGFPGFGSLTVDTLLTLDVPLIEATVLIAAVVYIGANLLADIGAVLLNPRLRTASE